MILGQEATIKQQAAAIGRLKRQVEDESDPAKHPHGHCIVAVVDRWRRATGHPKAKISKDRTDMVRARLKDGYSFEQMELAVDGLAAFAYVRNGKRVREGSPAERHDRLGIALGGGESLEKFAVLGHEARKWGWVSWG